MAAATPALAALIAAGVPHEVVKFEHDSRARSFGVEAVHALTAAGDIVAEQILKTLIIAVPNGLGVAILPASSTPAHSRGIGCTAVRAGADGTSRSRPRIWSG